MIYVLLLGLALSLVSGPAPAAEPAMTVNPMEAHPADPREPSEDSASTLVRNDGGVAVSVRTDGLDPESSRL